MDNRKMNSSLETMTIEDRKRYFKDYFIAHPHIVHATNELFNYIMQSDTDGYPAMIFIVGPSGVGKTTMIKKVSNEFWIYATENLGYNNSCIPIVVVEPKAPEGGNFDWRDYYYRTLMELNEPLISQKIDYKLLESNDQNRRININQRSTKADLRFALENAFKYRKVLVNIIDEAQHLTMLSSGRKLSTQMEVLKSLSNKSGVMHILVGTYDLLTLLNMNGQLSRRAQVIHLPRYDITVKEDKKHFIAVLNQFQQRLPFPEIPDLVKDWDYFYERSIGCIGILKDWIKITTDNVLDKKAKSITRKDFEKYALSVTQCTKMLGDAKAGENELTYNLDEKNILRIELGLNETAENDDDKKGQKKKKSVGERNPSRDKVGRYPDAEVL